MFRKSICYWSFAIGYFLSRARGAGSLDRGSDNSGQSCEFSSMIVSQQLSLYQIASRRIILSQIRVSLSSFKTIPNL